MPNVCVDIDGTVLDFHEGLRRRLAELGHTFIPENCLDYDFNGEIGCDKQVIFDLFKTDEELYYQLPFLDESREAVALLLEQGDTVYGYTASVENKNIFNHRERFVEELGMIPRVYVGRKPVMDADALFDDCLGVHKCWVRANSKAKLYLINQVHNQVTEENKDDPIWQHVIRCNSLMDAVQMYLKNKE